MTEEEARAKQAELEEYFDLGWWYGTSCEKCHGVYPRFFTEWRHGDRCYYQCEVCGKRTEEYSMPWQAKDAWNSGKTYFEREMEQLTLFGGER